jgi:hypothetical protein
MYVCMYMYQLSSANLSPLAFEAFIPPPILSINSIIAQARRIGRIRRIALHITLRRVYPAIHMLCQQLVQHV